LDSIHRLVCGRQNTTTFRRLDLSPSSGGWGRINLESKISPIALYNIHHRQNPFKSTNIFLLYGSKRQLFLPSKKAIVPLLATTDQSRFLIIFPNYLNLLYIYDDVFNFLKLKLNPRQHGFTKSNLVTYFDFITPLVDSQCQANAFYFDLTSASDLRPHSLLLHKPSSLVFSGGY
jgi:hypothetical protein